MAEVGTEKWVRLGILWRGKRVKLWGTAAENISKHMGPGKQDVCSKENRLFTIALLKITVWYNFH